jgi:hypothetical protein
MGNRVLAVLGLLSVAAFSSLRADEENVSCSMKSETGETYTLQLLVPSSGGGPCELTGLLPALPGDSEFTPTEVAEPPTLSARFGSPYSYNSGRGYAPDTRPLSPLNRLLISGIPFKNLGTLTAKDETHDDCRLIMNQSDGVIVLDSEGFYKILYADLDPDSRQRVMASCAPAAQPLVIAQAFVGPPRPTPMGPPVPPGLLTAAVAMQATASPALRPAPAPVAEQPAPSVQETPAAAQDAPADKPALSVTEQVALDVREAMASAAQNVPAAHAPEPVAVQPAPAVKETSVVVQQPAPVAEQPAPVVKEAAPLVAQNAPVAKPIVPVAEQAKPAPTHPKSVVAHVAPAARHTTAVAVHATPAAKHSVKIATHAAPAARHSTHLVAHAAPVKVHTARTVTHPAAVVAAAPTPNKQHAASASVSSVPGDALAGL